MELFKKVDKSSFDRDELDFLKKKIESMFPTEKEKGVVYFYRLFAKKNRYLSDNDIELLNRDLIISKGRRWGFRNIQSFPNINRERIIELIAFQEEMDQIERQLIMKNRKT